jgi:hypothetical protein
MSIKHDWHLGCPINSINDESIAQVCEFVQNDMILNYS